jgi:hypothetical protein
MMYLKPTDAERLKKIAKKLKVPMTQIVREAIKSRIATGDPYISGFNAGIDKSIEALEGWEMAQMRFPSGATFAERATDEIIKHRIPEVKDDESGSKS